MYLKKILRKIYIPFIGHTTSYISFMTGFFNKSKKAFWFDDSNNFGDILTPFLFEFLGASKVTKIDTQYYSFENYLTVGSILSKANSNTIVWGSGFISEESSFKYGNPKKICAVRGPKTRNKLLKMNIECPEIYGDPALLLPLYYKPNKLKKKYKLGVIPHYIDKDNKYLELFNREEILIIDIQNKDIFKFIDEVNSCEKIISSSLHGIIVGDAYGIPSLWIELSKKIMGNGFKFLDYFQSVGRKEESPIKINNSTTIDQLLESFYDYKIEIDLAILKDSCPFKK